MENQKLYAIWSYDLIPYFLIGEIERFDDDGRVTIVDMPGYRVNPVKIVNETAGKRIEKRLNEIKNTANTVIKNTKADVKRQTDALIFT